MKTQNTPDSPQRHRDIEIKTRRELTTEAQRHRVWKNKKKDFSCSFLSALILTLCLCVSVVNVFSAPVVFNTQEITGQSLNNPITVTAKLKLFTGNGMIIANGAPLVLQPVNGTVTTNLMAGLYNCTIQGVSSGFVINVLDNTTNVEDAKDISISGLTTFANGNLGASILLTGTNVYLAGPNIAFVTNMMGGFPVITITTTNVPLLAGTNAYSGTNTFTGPLLISNGKVTIDQFGNINTAGGIRSSNYIVGDIREASNLAAGGFLFAPALNTASQGLDGATTNYIADFGAASQTYQPIEQTITGSAPVNFLYATNGPGVLHFRIIAQANLTASFPVGWKWQNTNGFGVTNGAFSCMISNGQTGVLEVTGDLAPSSAVAKFSLAGGNGNPAGFVAKGNNLSEVANKTAAGNVGMLIMSPPGGNNATTDKNNATAAFAHSLGQSFYGSQTPFMWWAKSTTVGDWSGSFQFPGYQIFGADRAMSTNDAVPCYFYANSIPNQNDWLTNAAHTNITPADANFRMRNDHPRHYAGFSMDACWYDQTNRPDLFGSSEVGSVAWGNLEAGIYPGECFLESYGGRAPWYFVAGGMHIGGMQGTNNDFVWFDQGTNVVFRIPHGTGGGVTISNNLTFQSLLFGPGGHQLTIASGLLNASAIDPAGAIKITKIYPNNYTTAGQPLIDLGNNGTGLYFPSSDSSMSFAMAGNFVGKIDTSSNLTLVGTITAASVTANGAITTPTFKTGTGFTLTGTNSTVFITATGQTFTLPTAVGIQGREYKFVLTVTGSATIATTSSQNINGATTYSLSAQYKYLHVQSDNTQWWITANN